MKTRNKDNIQGRGVGVTENKSVILRISESCFFFPLPFFPFSASLSACEGPSFQEELRGRASLTMCLSSWSCVKHRLLSSWGCVKHRVKVRVFTSAAPACFCTSPLWPLCLLIVYWSCIGNMQHGRWGFSVYCLGPSKSESVDSKQYKYQQMSGKFQSNGLPRKPTMWLNSTTCGRKHHKQPHSGLKTPTCPFGLCGESWRLEISNERSNGFFEPLTGYTVFRGQLVMNSHVVTSRLTYRDNTHNKACLTRRTKDASGRYIDKQTQ